MSSQPSALSSQLSAGRLPPGTLVLTPELSFSLDKSARANGHASFGAYHGSQDTRFRDYTTGGFPNNSRPESDYLPRYDRARIIARLRVACRNNPHLYAILRNYVLALGTPHLKSQTGDANYDDAKERLFSRWAQDCEVEHDLSLDQVIEIKNFEAAIAGELFIIKRREGWLQLIASELCGSFQTKKHAVSAGTKFADGTPVPAGATECDGIIRDTGRFIIGYRFGTRDDQGQISFAPELSSIVQKQYVFHLFDPDRVEQGRGVPLLAPVMNVAQDVHETSEARAQQVKNASMLSLWITKNLDPYGFARTQQGVLGTGAAFQNIPGLKEIVEARSGHKEVRTGQVMYGAAGETLEVISPKLNSGDHHEHYIDLLRVICGCLNGMPVEIGLEGFRESSYSSSRATMNVWKSNVARIRRRDGQKFVEPLQLWQTNRARIFGDIGPAPKSSNPAVTYNTDENVRIGWPGIPDIDGAKTSAQNAIDLANGTTTREKIYADKGEDRDHEDKIFAKEKSQLLLELIAAGKTAGLDEAEAKAWALTQMPAQDPRVLAALLTATGALAAETAAPAAA